jgi:hypothetical protein
MNSPTILIGFSSASLPLGEMPFVREWSASGLRAGLAFPPAISSVAAWTSVMTGVGPAQHGIFDFYRRQAPQSQQLRVLASRDLSCETIWAALDRAGQKATILNYPMTFPAPKMEGHVMPGSWVSAKRLKLGCYPSGLYAELGALDGVDLNNPAAEPLLRMLLYLMEKDRSDLSVVLIRDKGPLDFAAIDRQIEHVVSAAGPDATVLLISEPNADNVSINGWLAEHGYLTWAASANGSAADGKVLETADLNRQAALIDWTKTQAWCPPCGGNGIFIVSETPNFRTRLMEELSSAEGLSRVWKQEELYPGPFQELAPDLVVELSGITEGILLAAGPAIQRGAPFTRIPLSSVTPILLYTLGLQMPGEIEGCVPAEVLNPDWLAAHPLLSAGSNSNREADKPLIDPAAEEEILQRLRGLGYIE